MPEALTCVRQATKSKFYVALDLKAGYNNNILDKLLKKHTRFVTQDGVYKFEWLTFGHKNAPTHF